MNNHDKLVDELKEQIQLDADQYHFDLVKGVFNLEDLKMVILNLITDKITFHQQILHSETERFGRDRMKSQNRIEELIETRTQLIKWFKLQAENDDLYDIIGKISITKK